MNLKKEINREEIENLIPHRKPFLLIDKLIDIVPLISAPGLKNIKKTSEEAIPVVGKGLTKIGVVAKGVAVKSAPVVEKGVVPESCVG